MIAVKVTAEFDTGCLIYIDLLVHAWIILGLARPIKPMLMVNLFGPFAAVERTGHVTVTLCLYGHINYMYLCCFL